MKVVYTGDEMPETSILDDYLEGNGFQVWGYEAKKNSKALDKALRKLYPNDPEILGYTLPIEDCKKVLELAIRYSKLWIFS